MKWRITRLEKRTFQYWDDRRSEWTADKTRAATYDTKPTVVHQSNGGRCWAEIAR